MEEEADDARLRALVSETPLGRRRGPREPPPRRRASVASATSLARSIAELEREQDALLDRMAAEQPSH